MLITIEWYEQQALDMKEKIVFVFMSKHLHECAYCITLLLKCLGSLLNVFALKQIQQEIIKPAVNV